MPFRSWILSRLGLNNEHGRDDNDQNALSTPSHGTNSDSGTSGTSRVPPGIATNRRVLILDATLRRAAPDIERVLTTRPPLLNSSQCQVPSSSSSGRPDNLQSQNTLSDATPTAGVAELEDFQCASCRKWFGKSKVHHAACCQTARCAPCITFAMRYTLGNPSVITRSVLPVICCRRYNFARDLPTSFVNPELLDRYILAFEETSCPYPKRTYCSIDNTYIPRGFISGRKALCPSCFQLTCASCTEAYHTEKNECESDWHRNARELGATWCPRCRNLVLRPGGCGVES